MRLVNTYLSVNEIDNNQVNIIKSIISYCFNNSIEVHKYKYEDRKYYEVDFDFDLVVEKNKILNVINKLIKMHEENFKLIDQDFDIIVSNDDTETEILIYEKDYNNISTFGLFLTKRDIPNVKKYYESSICNAYLNFDYVSFGVVF